MCRRRCQTIMFRVITLRYMYCNYTALDCPLNSQDRYHRYKHWAVLISSIMGIEDVHYARRWTSDR